MLVGPTSEGDIKKDLKAANVAQGIDEYTEKIEQIMMVMVPMMVGMNSDGMAECVCHAGITVYLGVSSDFEAL